MSNDLKRRLILEGNAAGAMRALDAVRKAQSELDKELKRTGNTAAGTGRFYEALARSQAKLTRIAGFDARRALRDLERTYEELEAAAASATREQIDGLTAVQREARRTGNTLQAAGGRAAGSTAAPDLGQTATSFSDVSGALGAFGSGTAGEALAAANAIVSGVDGIKNFATQVKNLGPGAVASAGALGVLSAALAVAVTAFQEQAENVRGAAGNVSTQINSIADAQRRTTEENRAQLAELEAQLARQQQVAAQSQRSLDQAYDDIRAGIPIIGDFAARAFDAAGAYDDLRANIEGVSAIQSEIDGIRKVLEAGTNAAADNARVLEIAAQKERELAAERQSALSALEGLTAQIRDLEAAADQAATDQAFDRNRQDLRAFQDSERARARAQEDLDRALETQQQQHQQRLIDIAERSAEQIEQTRQALADREAAAIKRVADLRQQAAADEARQQTRFDLDNRRRLEDFQRQELRNRADFRRQLEDIERSFEQTRFDAILNNDVLSFINAQRDRTNNRQDARGDFRIERDRGREDFNTETGRNREDFEAERAERQQALAERIADINRELAEFRKATAEKIDATAQQAAAEIAATEAAYAERLADDAAAREIIRAREEEDRRVREFRLEQDRATADERAQRALNAQLERLDTAAAAEQAKIDTLSADIQTLRSGEITLVNRLIDRLNAANSAAGATAAIGSSATGRPIPNRPADAPFGFANGGIIPQGKRGLGMFEGLTDEAVIPLDSARGRSMLGGFTFAPTLRFESVTIGDTEFIDRPQVEEMFNSLIGALEEAFAARVAR